MTGQTRCPRSPRLIAAGASISGSPCSRALQIPKQPRTFSSLSILATGSPSFYRERWGFDCNRFVAMGKVPVKLKEVTYTLSPYHQHVFSGLYKDLPYKLGKRFNENWVSALTLLTPILGTYWYAENYKEKEKLHHRY